MPELLPRFYRRMQELEDAEKLGRILLEADAEPHPDSNGRVLRRSASGWNRSRARGIPIVGRVGGGGASPGTNPLAALLAKERSGKLWR